jgi:hypothetical protein
MTHGFFDKAISRLGISRRSNRILFNPAKSIVTAHYIGLHYVALLDA